MPVTDKFKTVRLPEDFFQKVRRVADKDRRSIAKQIQRWCQLGAAAEANPTLTGQQVMQQYVARKDAIQ
jgi:hypothetical protein